jgi:hypothetical protein
MPDLSDAGMLVPSREGTPMLGDFTDAHLILYVRDQDRSTAFYEAALGRSP